MSATHRPLALALTLAILAGCTADRGLVDPGGDDDPTGETMPAEERMAALGAVEAQFEAFGEAGLEGDALNQAIAAWLGARTEFEAVGIDESSSVWARFVDGRLLIIVNNLEEEPDDDAPSGSAAEGRAGLALVGAAGGAVAGTTATTAASTAASHAAAALASMSNEPYQIPQSRRARLLHTFTPGTRFANGAQDVIAEMALMLGEAGYTVRTDIADASVTGLRTISGDGFFYVNTHGGKGQSRIGTQVDVYALQTSTRVTLLGDVDSLTRADLNAGRLVYLMGSTSDKVLGVFTEYDTRYAITSKFVDHYMSFDPNAFVFINACFSANPHAEIGSFIFEFHRKGASVYLGWTRTVGDWTAWHGAKYLTDRLAGSNRYEPAPSRHRPFPLVPVLEHMNDIGYAAFHDSFLRVVPASQTGAGFGLLRPTIERVQIDTSWTTAPFGSLLVYGRFGSDPGAANRSVVIHDGGSEIPLEVHLWTADSIRVMPVTEQSQPGFSGDVIVTVRDRRSNARRLHAWHGTAKYTQTIYGSLNLAIDLDIVARFDADSVRAKPGEAAQPNNRVHVFRVTPYPAVEARWNASGSAALEACTVTWSGSGTVTSASPTGSRFYGFLARLHPQTRQLVVEHHQLTDLNGYTQSCGGVSDQVPVFWSTQMFITEGASDPWIRYDVDTQWRLLARTQTITGDGVELKLESPLIAPMPVYDGGQAK